MRIAFLLSIAVALDLLLGDPRFLPHPVRGLGWLAARCEAFFRRRLADGAAGIATVAAVLLGAGGTVFIFFFFAERLSPVLADVCRVLVLYFSFAARDLAEHGLRVRRALAENDLLVAREQVAMMVGRDTAMLDAGGVSRACVESIAENSGDGVIAPLFYAALFGPMGAVVYKAVNTMDSMFGYTSERYLAFGRAAARLDDAANWLPSRLAALCIVVAAPLVHGRLGTAARVWQKDHGKHLSPNSGHPEAAMAGALGIRLGGPASYDGRGVERPLMNAAGRNPRAGDIDLAICLLFAAAGLALVMLLPLSILLAPLWLPVP